MSQVEHLCTDFRGVAQQQAGPLISTGGAEVSAKGRGMDSQAPLFNSAPMLQRSGRAVGLVEPCVPSPQSHAQRSPTGCTRSSIRFSHPGATDAKSVRLYTRNGHDFSKRCSQVIGIRRGATGALLLFCAKRREMHTVFRLFRWSGATTFKGYSTGKLEADDFREMRRRSIRSWQQENMEVVENHASLVKTHYQCRCTTRVRLRRSDDQWDAK